MAETSFKKNILACHVYVFGPPALFGVKKAGRGSKPYRRLIPGGNQYLFYVLTPSKGPTRKVK